MSSFCDIGTAEIAVLIVTGTHLFICLQMYVFVSP